MRLQPIVSANSKILLGIFLLILLSINPQWSKEEGVIKTVFMFGIVIGYTLFGVWMRMRIKRKSTLSE
jgi:hypothetical protein